MAIPLLRKDISRTPSDWSDRQLLAFVLRNDGTAWRELVRRFRSLIYRCITKVTGKYAPYMSESDLDEVYAEVMMSLVRDDMRKLRVYDPQRGMKLGSWLGMISVNATYDYLRSSNRRPLLDRVDGIIDPVEDCERSPLETLLEKERWNSLNGLLTDFSDKDRQFLHLYYAQGMEPDEVASEMAISLKTVYSKKHKIRAHLRRCLDSVGTDSAISDLALAAA